MSCEYLFTISKGLTNDCLDQQSENIKMYSNKFVSVIKHNGKILQESREIIHLPFGSEYSILLKNLNTVRASVKISIDGEYISDGSFIVPINGSIDIERFVKNNDVGNRFKFIERIEAIEKHRGIHVDDGIIRIEYQFEEIQFQSYTGIINTGNWTHDAYPSNQIYAQSGGIMRGFSSKSIQSLSTSNTSGITAPGSISNQKFQITSSFPLQLTKHVICFKLVGVQKEVQVSNPVYTRSTNKCSMCNATSKSSANFCSNCGTSLNLA